MNSTISKIELLDNADQVNILMLRYMDGMTWEDIPVHTGLSYNKVQYLNKRAMKKLLLLFE